MGKHIASTNLSSTLTLSECSDGWWLYDVTRGMNLAMQAKSPNEAFVKALTYYQERLSTVEQEYKKLHLKVVAFVEQVTEGEE